MSASNHRSKPSVKPEDLRIEYVSISSLNADPTNPRTISEEELAKLERSIAENGFVEPVIVSNEGSVIIAGHQRVKAAARLGIRNVPVVVIDIDVAASKLLNIALNKISGEFDVDMLEQFFAEIDANFSDIDATLSGFDQIDIDGFLNSLETKDKRDQIETFDVTEALSPPELQTTTKSGDVFALGSHRIVCGDARSEEDLELLLKGEKVKMMFTDPPLFVNFERKSTKSAGTSTAIVNDNLPEGAWRDFVDDWVRNCVTRIDGAMYICPGIKELDTLNGSLERHLAHWSDTLIWVKNRFTLGRADYQREFEPIWYGWPAGVKRYWCGDRNQSDVWRIDRPNESPLHPTMKPIELIERAIENSTKIGDTVLDPFLGSGSSLIAAERTGRRLHGVEISPKYVDVAIARWESFTGETAQKVTK
jgi:DNA modification methylase